MNIKISQRRQFLSRRIEQNKRLTIGFAGIADLRSFIAIEYLSGMMKASDDYGINFVNMGAAVKYSLFDDINFLNNYLKNFKFMKKPFVDGMITWASSLADFIGEEKTVELFNSLRPLSIVDIGHSEIKGALHIKIDAESAVYEIMDHLTKVHGYSRFAFFGADVSKPHWNRLKTYQDYLSSHSIKEMEDSVYMAQSMSSNHIAQEVDKLCSVYNLRDRKTIDAIVCTTDIIACEIIEELNRKGISVPKDIAVTGFNNWYEGITSRSPLTTVDLSYYKRGYAAVEYLIDKIISQSEETQIVKFKASVIIRQSCGCFESSIKQSICEEVSDKNTVASLISSGSIEDIKNYLVTRCHLIFNDESDERLKVFVSCFFADLYTPQDKSHMLLWLQKKIQDKRTCSNFDGYQFQNAVSLFRSLVMPFIEDENIKTYRHMEDIFHEMRTLVSVFQKYEITAARENPYRINNISEHALSFMEADSIEKVFELLKTQLGRFDIPGAVIALSDTMTYSFPSPEIKFIYPDSGKKIFDSIIGKKITDASEFPKQLFEGQGNYSVILEVLGYNDYYFGYGFFVMKDPNIANYDVLRMLLSSTLYRIYRRKSGIRTADYDKISREQLSSIIDENKTLSIKSSSRRLSVAKLTDYLTSHTGDKTDIDRMAEDFMVSRSFLCKKTRELTGYTVQTLHEKIKIEQAKNMLMSDIYDMSEIALKLGFSSQNYFSSVFKKNTGVSPLNWLKKNR